MRFLDEDLDRIECKRRKRFDICITIFFILLAALALLVALVLGYVNIQKG